MKTSCEILIFASSSGHCTLNCPYCIVHPIAKNEQSLNFEDFRYLIKKFGKKILFGFSGKGDFFAGYKPSEKLLARLLKENIEVALDINGVLLHEFGKIPDEYLKKIIDVNLTMHYQQLKINKLLDQWKNNALTIIQRKQYNLLLGTIISPLTKRWWREALVFYEQEIFAQTQHKIVLVRDIENSLNNEDEASLKVLENDFAHIIQYVHNEDFSLPFKNNKHVLCPAGSTYFRVWNDGTLQGCPNIKALEYMGNVIKRNIQIRETHFSCSEPGYCDCAAINSFGRMIFE
jgi:MoaA/NifB/PqqE/SkfB family radical SAM enzyme